MRIARDSRGHVPPGPKALNFNHLGALFFRTMWCPADSEQMRIARDSRGAVKYLPELRVALIFWKIQKDLEI